MTSKSLSQKSRLYPERKEARGSIASEALRGALVLRDGLSGLLRMRAGGGAMAFETASKKDGSS